MDNNLFLVEFEVGCDCSCRQVCSFSKYRITHIIEMTNLCLVQNNTILELSAVSDYAAISNYHIASNVSPFSYLTVLADDGWSFNHGTMLNYCPFTNDNIFINEDGPNRCDVLLLLLGMH